MLPSESETRSRVLALWREKLDKAADRHRLAHIHIQKVISEYESMPRADGDLALIEALEEQHETANEYAAVFRALTKWTIEGELPQRERIWIDVTHRIEAERSADQERGPGALVNIPGILSICMQCKNIRDADDGWVPFERYIGRHLRIQLSHGLCPECSKIYYKKG